MFLKVRLIYMTALTNTDAVLDLCTSAESYFDITIAYQTKGNELLHIIRKFPWSFYEVCGI